jgi:hypothetical protein
VLFLHYDVLCLISFSLVESHATLYMRIRIGHTGFDREYKLIGFNLHAFVFCNHVQEAGSQVRQATHEIVTD